jgi:hypothetical protein
VSGEGLVTCGMVRGLSLRWAEALWSLLELIGLSLRSCTVVAYLGRACMP